MEMQLVPPSVCPYQWEHRHSIRNLPSCVCMCVNRTSLGRGSQYAERTLHLGSLPGVDGDDVRTDGNGEGWTCGSDRDNIIKGTGFERSISFFKNTHAAVPEERCGSSVEKLELRWDQPRLGSQMVVKRVNKERRCTTSQCTTTPT